VIVTRAGDDERTKRELAKRRGRSDEAEDIEPEVIAVKCMIHGNTELTNEMK
jgi:hypothetical protein